VGFGISGVETWGSATRVLVKAITGKMVEMLATNKCSHAICPQSRSVVMSECAMKMSPTEAD